MTGYENDEASAQLTSRVKPGVINYNIGCDALGNIVTKSDLNIPDAVTLNYGNTTNPHALTSITGKPDAIPPDSLEVSYTDFRKIKMLSEGAKQYSITYGVDDQRRRTDYTANGITETRYYLGDYEEESDNTGNVKKIHYLRGGAVFIQNNGVETLYYGHTDNQGSLIALTDENGNVVEQYAYDPWGARRNPADWQLKDTRSNFITNRGYTGHEHLDAFNIINMNGRVYDPVTAMFFSPDPLMQSPGDWMNYNQYSYVMNNPTRSTDPTGYYAVSQDSGPTGCFNFGLIGRGKTNWDPYGFHANTYYFDGNGSFFNWNGDVVPFNEIYNNYLLPNSSQLRVTNTFSFDLNRAHLPENSLPFSIRQDIDGIHFTNHQSWYIRDGLEGLEKILNDPSESNNVQEGGGSNGAYGLPESDILKYTTTGTSVWSGTIQTGFDAVRKLQPTVSTWIKGAKILGRTSNILGSVLIAYDFSTGTANTSTILNGVVMIGGAIIIGAVGIAAAPWVAAGGVGLGIISVAGGDRWLNTNFDISGHINFVKPIK